MSRKLRWVGLGCAGLLLFLIGVGVGAAGKSDAPSTDRASSQTAATTTEPSRTASPAATPSDTPTPAPTPEATPKPKKPKPPGVGDSITLAGNDDGEELTVKVLKVLDPLQTGEFEEPDSGKRYIGVELQLKNSGSTPYDDSPSNGATLIYGDDRQVDSALVINGPCAGGFSSSVKLRPGSKRRGCIAFEIPASRKAKTFQFALDSGFADDAGEWRL